MKYIANHLKLPSTKCLFILLSYVASILASRCHAGPEISHKSTLHPLSYNLEPRDFPNDRLYRAYLIIQRFKNTITSDPKSITASWSGRDICGETTYLGFYCAAPRRDKALTVTAVILNGFDLRAPTLQGFVDQLPDLALFHAASNYFGNNIPRLNSLPYLYNLNVGNDLPVHPSADINFQGQTSIGCVTANIKFNFTVDIPRKKGKGNILPAVATNSKALLLNDNHLSGGLPSNLGHSKLSYLAVANNKLTGPIPPSIRYLQDSLLEVLLLNNQLSGCLPYEVGMLNNAAVIDAGMNQLTGPIPSSFSCLSGVEQLNLAGNRLYGDVPDSLCKLAGPAGSLANLTLSGNYFTSVGLACAALIQDGVLDVKNNCIPGLTNQRRPAECAAFQSQPKTCPAASTQVTCPAAATKNAAARGERKARDYSSYVTYATLHE